MLDLPDRLLGGASFTHAAPRLLRNGNQGVNDLVRPCDR
jgi:hypothetical protein